MKDRNRAEMLGKMIVIATNAHAGQLDKGGSPYILHTLAVMGMVKSNDLEVKAIAVGHDLFEDTSVTKQELLDAGISQRVVDGILSMTKMPGETFDEYKQKVKNNKDAILVKMADLRHNSDITRLKGLTAKDFERTARYMQFYSELQEVIEI